MISAPSALSAFSVEFGPWGAFCMTTAGMHDNGGPAPWSCLCQHPSFTWRDRSASKREWGGHAASAFNDTCAPGNLTLNFSLRRSLIGLLSTPQQGVSGLEGLCATLTGLVNDVELLLRLLATVIGALHIYLLPASLKS
jgi:hypothetical protein